MKYLKLLLLSILYPVIAGAQIDPTPMIANVDTIISLGSPGPIVPTETDVVPVVAGGLSVSAPSTLILATDHGSGKVVALGHDGLLTNGSIVLYDNQTFFDNTFAWLDATGSRQIVVTQGHGEWLGGGNFDTYKAHLESSGYTVTRDYGTIESDDLNGAGVLMVGNAWGSFTQAEIDHVENFVSNGGGLIVAGLGWSWLGYHPGSTMDDFPMMQLCAPYGFQWADGTINDPDYSFSGAPLFYTFYPNTGIQSIFNAMAYIRTTTDAHPSDLPGYLQVNASARSNYTNSHLLLRLETMIADVAAPSRTLIYDFMTNLITDYPQFYSKPPHFDPSVESTMAWLRERAHRTLIDGLPRTPQVIADISTTLGLFAEYDTVWTNHQILLNDNTNLSPTQLSFMVHYLREIDSSLINLRGISVRDYLGATTPEVPLSGLGGSVNTFGFEVGQYSENEFPADFESCITDVFCIATAHEVNHIVDAHYVANHPALNDRKADLISAAGYDSLQYLRSMLNSGFFVEAPQEFVASIANQWFCSSLQTINLGLMRFVIGWTEPINQALFFCEIYSLGTNSTEFFTIDTDGNLSQESIPVSRNDNGFINRIMLNDSAVVFDLDEYGNVLDYSRIIVTAPELTIRYDAGGLILRWSSDAFATSYQIHRSDLFAGPYTPIATVQGLTYTDQDVGGHAFYFIQVHYGE